MKKKNPCLRALRDKTDEEAVKTLRKEENCNNTHRERDIRMNDQQKNIWNIQGKNGIFLFSSI